MPPDPKHFVEDIDGIGVAVLHRNADVSGPNWRPVVETAALVADDPVLAAYQNRREEPARKGARHLLAVELKAMHAARVFAEADASQPHLQIRNCDNGNAAG